MNVTNHNKGRKLPAEPLAPDEAQRLLRTPSNRAPTGVRNRALIVLLWRAGLRIAEALALRPKDLNPEKGEIRVLHGKGDKQRSVGMDPEGWAVVLRWLDRREKLGINGHHPVICTLKGKPVKDAYVRALLPRLARKAGIEKRVHAHGLRHTMADEMRGEGIDVGIISKQLGHSSISTTARYLDHVSPKAVIDVMKQREWCGQTATAGESGEGKKRTAKPTATAGRS
jgi:site-specific recombinase XerD